MAESSCSTRKAAIWSLVISETAFSYTSRWAWGASPRPLSMKFVSNTSSIASRFCRRWGVTHLLAALRIWPLASTTNGAWAMPR